MCIQTLKFSLLYSQVLTGYNLCYRYTDAATVNDAPDSTKKSTPSLQQYWMHTFSIEALSCLSEIWTVAQQRTLLYDQEK